jgi:hypothetical protein
MVGLLLGVFTGLVSWLSCCGCTRLWPRPSRVECWELTNENRIPAPRSARPPFLLPTQEVHQKNHDLSSRSLLDKIVSYPSKRAAHRTNRSSDISTIGILPRNWRYVERRSALKAHFETTGLAFSTCRIITSQKIQTHEASSDTCRSREKSFVSSE